MSDQATQQLRIDATVDELLAVLTDFESYPSWARDIKQVSIDERDGDGRATKVTYRAAAMGRSTSYTLAYDWSQLPHRLPWTLVSGDIMRVLDGAYVFEPSGDATEVTYHLEVDLVVPLPSFIKRRAQSRIMTTALRELRAHVEG